MIFCLSVSSCHGAPGRRILGPQSGRRGRSDSGSAGGDESGEGKGGGYNAAFLMEVMGFGNEVALKLGLRTTRT